MLALPACQSEGAGAGLNTGEAVALSGIKIDLPPPPSFADQDQPVSFPDGTVTVFGLRKQLEKYLGKEVKVKAYLLAVYQCPPCPKGQTCKLCDQPHFFLSDKPAGKLEKALMVVDYLMPKQKPPALTLGKQYTVEGGFSRNSPSGFGSSDGLLTFTRLTDDKNVEFISTAAAMEAKALKGEADEAAQLAKAGKTKSAAMKKE